MNSIFSMCYLFSLLVIMGLIPQAIFAIELKIDSNKKDSKVYSVGPNGENLELGTTPLTIKKFESKSHPTILILKKGYVPVYIPISQKLKSKVSIMVNLKALNVWSLSQYKNESQKLAEDLLDQVLLIQSLLDSRKVEMAIPMIQDLKRSYPKSISVGVLYANSLLMSGKRQLAQAYYEDLLEKIPDNRSILKKMVRTLNNKLKALMRRR